MKTMTTNVMKKFLKKLPKDIENIIKDDIKDILVSKSQKEVINQLKEVYPELVRLPVVLDGNHFVRPDIVRSLLTCRRARWWDWTRSNERLPQYTRRSHSNNNSDPV